MKLKLENNVFEFAQSFKQYWFKHSNSEYAPSFMILGKDGVCSCVIVVDDEKDFLPIIKLYKAGADINLAAICINRAIESKSSLSVLHFDKDEFKGKIFNYSLNNNELTWGEEKNISVDEKNSWLLIQSIMSQSSDHDNKTILESLGFNEARQFYHNYRSVCCYVNDKFKVFIIDLLSAKHPEWCDASMKLKKLCDFLLHYKHINQNCYEKLMQCENLLGSESFIQKVITIIDQEIEKCDANFIVSSNFFAEKLQKNIFDFKYDLHKSELISW